LIFGHLVKVHTNVFKFGQLPTKLAKLSCFLKFITKVIGIVNVVCIHQYFTFINVFTKYPATYWISHLPCPYVFSVCLDLEAKKNHIYLTVILRGRAGYELIYITNDSLDFFWWNLKSWHFLYRRRREKNFSDLQNFSTRNLPSVFPYLVKLNDNGSHHALREPIRKLEKSLSWAKNLLIDVI